MRNLKKLLALTLAMVMAFSLMLSANAVSYSDYGDKDQITEEFKEAVQVLTGLEVFQGDEKGFRPADTITRAEAAAIVYRVATQDVKDTQAKLYSDYGTFTDVNKDDWFAGYVGYCQNAGYIKGTSPTTFNPYGKVTGYEMLAMILRVVGYGKNNEFTGPSWQVNVASLSKELGVINKVKSANFEHTLTMAARRDVVASLVFETMVKVPTVTYTPALSYSDKISLTSEFKNPTLGQKAFGLWHETGWKATGKWGAPGYDWLRDGTHIRNSSNQLLYDADTKLPVYGGSSTVVATILPEATKTYDQAGVHECDVAHDLEIKTSENFNLYVNRNTRLTDKYLIVATDTVTRVGGQGRETKFWYDVTSEYAGDMPNWCTMVDTYLATVTKVTDQVLDPKGHEIVPATVTLDVYDGNGVGTVDKTTAYAKTNTVRNTSVHLAKATGYAVGDKVLVQGYTDYRQGQGTTAVAKANLFDLNHDPLRTGLGVDITEADAVERQNRAAFETNILQNPNNTTTTNKKLWITGKATEVQGKQTVTYWNQAKHTVDGKDYNDAMTLYLDVAGTTTNTTYAWYLDGKGNLIGIDYVPNTVNYGVITSIYSAFNQGDTSTDGTAKAIAKVLYADGTEGTITIDRFLMSHQYSSGKSLHGGVDTQLVDQGKGHTVGASHALTDNKVSVELIPVYDNSTGDVMTASQRGDANTKVDNALSAGWLHVAPVISVNAVEDGSNLTKYFGILRGNMFKFVNSADGDMTAIEVAGKKDASHSHENDGVYEWNYNAAPAAGKIYKNYSYVALNTGAQAGDIWLDANTRIMVRGWDGTDPTNTVKCYTLATLPGDVDFGDREIDWSDPNGDGRADYVYVTGEIEGTITYGLFYYNGGAAQWNGVDKKGTAFGWLNGVPTTVEFDDEDEFNLVKNSQVYAGHLFALQLTNGVVSNVMGEDTTNTAHMEWLLNNETTQAAKAAVKINGNVELATTVASGGVTAISGAFGLGSANAKFNNPYTANTEMVYVKDTGNNVSYDRDTKTVTVTGTPDVYYLTPGTKVIGLGMNVNQEDAILDYLNHSTGNDVTIVYEQTNVKSIVEIYVATDPNVTPGNGSSTLPSGQAGAADAIGGANGKQIAASSVAGLGANVGNAIKVTALGTDANMNNRLQITGATANELLFFPFMLNGGGSARLRIMKSDGTVVHSESGSFKDNGLNATTDGGTDGNTAGLHTFVLNITTMVTLNKGETYKFVIDTAGGNGWAELASGSFKLGT